MFKKLLFPISAVICTLLFLNFPANAQISAPGTPKSISLNLSKQDIDTKIMPQVDIVRLQQEDRIEAQMKDIPLRFGLPMDVNYSLENSGNWRDVTGGRVWRLAIKSAGAFSINLIYNRFHMPDGGELFIYNDDRSMMIGAFNTFNNRKDRLFSTQPVKGDKIILEYFEPERVRGEGEILISSVIHAYKNIFGFFNPMTDDYGQSGSCNNNVNCPVGVPWKDQSRSVAMILSSGGSRLCTGSMVNNTRNDGTPFFMSANHCGAGSAATWIFMFRYEAPTCTNQDGPTTFTISGSTLLANNASSDFLLARLSSRPPQSYNVYYSGWSRKDTVTPSATGIHHPNGDIKKISFSSQTLSDTWVGTPANSHWRTFWTSGVTEPGSSGSPLYDVNHRYIGQLHGGPSACGASQLEDLYGKFSMSWDLGGTPSTRLKDWLDSNNTGVFVIDGYDPFGGPQIIHTPLGNTENLSGPYVVNAVITSSVAPIVPAQTKLFWGRGAAITDSIVMTNLGSNNYRANIPGNGSPATYKYYLRSLDTAGRVGVLPAGAPGSVFTFNAATDTQNPVIGHTPIVNYAKPSWPATVSANVTDNIGIDSVWVKWFKNTTTNGVKQFKLLNTTGSTFAAAFNSVNSDVQIGDSVFYKIYAQDNSTAHNRDSTSQYRIRIVNVFLCEGFTDAAFPPASWSITSTGTLYWTRNAVSSYGIGTGSAKFDFWAASSGTTQSLNSLSFGSTIPNDTLRFDEAYAPYTSGTDSLIIETSTNGGSLFTRLVPLWGNAAGGPLNTTTTQTSAFTPTSTQWATKKYALPAGTNQVRFTAKSGFGNNLYIDSICVRSTGTGVQNIFTGIPSKYDLSQNYPNPFNPVTRINYALPKQGMVILKIYDITGREIAILVNEIKPAGYYNLDFNGINFASGVYFYRITANDFIDTKRMVLIK
jgi:hypothetical protein